MRRVAITGMGILSCIGNSSQEVYQIQHDRAGIIIGNIGNMQDIYRQCSVVHERKQKLGGIAYQKVMGCSVSGNLSVLLGTQGYSLTVTAACATGAAAIG